MRFADCEQNARRSCLSGHRCLDRTHTLDRPYKLKGREELPKNRQSQFGVNPSVIYICRNGRTVQYARSGARRELRNFLARSIKTFNREFSGISLRARSPNDLITSQFPYLNRTPSINPFN